MAYKLNKRAMEVATDLLVKGRIDDGPWLPLEHIDEASILGADGGEPSTDTIRDVYGTFFLGVTGDGTTVDQYAFPFTRHDWGEKPRVSIAALRLIRIQAGMTGNSELFRAVAELLSLATGNQFSAEFKAGDIESMDDDGWWVEVFRSGTWTGATGGTITYTDDDLDAIVDSFKSTFPEVRPVLRLSGHPGVGDGIKPAVGLVTDLKREGSKLLAYFSNVPKIVKEAIKAKNFVSVSCGFWKDWAYDGRVFPNLLNHVALLGAELPAVSGLAELGAYLSKGGHVPAEVICYTQIEPNEEDDSVDTIESLRADVAKLNEQVTNLTNENAKLKTSSSELEKKNQEFAASAIKAEVETVVDDAVKDGRLLPKNRDDAVSVGIALRSASVNLTAGQADPFDAWKTTLKNSGKAVEFSEKGKVGTADESVDSFEKDYEKGASFVKGRIQPTK